MQVKKQQMELDIEQQTGSKLGKKYIKAVYCHPAYLTSMQSTSCKMPGWMKHKLNQDCQEKYQYPQICRWHQPMAESEEELKSPWSRWKRRVKNWPKTQHSKNEDHGIQSHHFMANRWGSNGNSERLYFLGLQITADGDSSHEIKRHLLLERKAMTKLDSRLKTETLLCQQRSI